MFLSAARTGSSAQKHPMGIERWSPNWLGCDSHSPRSSPSTHAQHLMIISYRLKWALQVQGKMEETTVNDDISDLMQSMKKTIQRMLIHSLQKQLAMPTFYDSAKETILERDNSYNILYETVPCYESVHAIDTQLNLEILVSNDFRPGLSCWGVKPIVAA